MTTTRNLIDTYFGKCRCCLRYGYLKNMWASYNYKEKTEIYGCIIKQCFGLTCSPIEGVEDRICDECILNLRNANNFKKLVMESQNILRSGNEDNKKGKDKQWTEQDMGFGQYIKVEFQEDKLNTAHEVPNHHHSIDTGPMDNTDYKEVEYLEEDIFDTAELPRIPMRKQKPKTRSQILIEGRVTLAKFKKNITTILDNSNATAIKGHWGIGYGCCYCQHQSVKPGELKKHVLDQHDDVKHNIAKVKSVMDLSVRLDVTGLCCTLCNKNFYHLEEFIRHLSTHKIKYHRDIKDFIVPYKFESDELKCALCPEEFEHFKYLSEHMTVHYGNYQCSVCNKGFINGRAHRAHRFRHQKGSFICSYCSKFFDTFVKTKDHERIMHVKNNLTYKCGYCNEKFKDLARKVKHEVSAHGVEPPVNKCKICFKTFSSRVTLKNHVNAIHLLILPHKCPECGKAYNSRDKMRQHAETHSGRRNYRCHMCSKCYATNKSLKRHERTHDDEKRLSCEKCGQMFMQKDSLEVHIRDNH